MLLKLIKLRELMGQRSVSSRGNGAWQALALTCCLWPCTAWRATCYHGNHLPTAYCCTNRSLSYPLRSWVRVPPTDASPPSVLCGDHLDWSEESGCEIDGYGTLFNKWLSPYVSHWCPRPVVTLWQPPGSSGMAYHQRGAYTAHTPDASADEGLLPFVWPYSYTFAQLDFCAQPIVAVARLSYFGMYTRVAWWCCVYTPTPATPQPTRYPHWIFYALCSTGGIIVLMLIGCFINAMCCSSKGNVDTFDSNTGP